MKLSEAWSLSKITYSDVAYKSVLQTKGGSAAYSYMTERMSDSRIDLRQNEVRRSIQTARLNKLVMAVVVSFVSVVPIALYGTNPGPSALAGGASLALAVLLAFTVLYGVQILSAFVDAESLKPLSSLPLSGKDVSLVALFSFIRTMDYVVVAGVAASTAAIGFFSGSLSATFLEFIGSGVDVVFAAAISLFMAKMFYGNIAKGGRSRTGGVLRLLFVLTWGMAIMSMGFFYNIVSSLTPVFEAAILHGNKAFLTALSLVYPFSVGVALELTVYGGSLVSFLLSFIALAGYLSLAVLAGIWSINSAVRITTAKPLGNARRSVTDFFVKLRRPLLAHALKDFRVASRNLATASLFAAPVFETIIIILQLTLVSDTFIGPAPIIASTLIGGFFATLVTFGLLNAEATGFEYTSTLPIARSTMIRSKALTATLSFAPVPVMLSLLSLVKTFSSPTLVMLPFVLLLGVAAASIVEIRIFMAIASQGRITSFNAGAGMLPFLISMVGGGVVVGLPFVPFLVLGGVLQEPELGLLLAGAVAIAELALSLRLSSHKT
jgi:hypothetical protein